MNKAAGTYWLFPSILVELFRCNRFRGFNSQSNRAHLAGNTKPIDAHSLHLIKISFRHFLWGRLKSWNTHNFIRHFFRTRKMGFCSQSKNCGELIKHDSALGRQDFGHHSTDWISECLELIVSESLSPADATTLQLMLLQPLLYFWDSGGLMMNSQEISVHNAHIYRRSIYIFNNLVWERWPPANFYSCAKGF